MKLTKKILALLAVSFLTGCAFNHGPLARTHKSPFAINIRNYESLRFTTVQPLYMYQPLAAQTGLEIVTVRTRDYRRDGKLEQSRSQFHIWTSDITESRSSRRSR